MSIVDRFRPHRITSSEYPQLLLPEGKVTVLDIPGKIPDRTILLLPGFGHGIRELETPARQLSRLGRVLVFEYPRREMNFRPEDRTEAQKEASLAEGILAEKGIEEPVIAVGHSYGAIKVVELIKRGKVKTAVLVNPMGLIDPRPNPVRYLAGQAVKSTLKSTQDDDPAIRAERFRRGFATVYRIQNNFWSAGREFIEAAKADIVDDIRAAGDSGVRSVVLHTTGDLYARYDEVAKNANAAGVDLFISIPGNHNAIHERTGTVIEHLVYALTPPTPS